MNQRHESEDINKNSLFPKFQLIPSSNFQVMHDYVCFNAPIDYWAISCLSPRDVIDPLAYSKKSQVLRPR